ncbi:MAG: GNAT family N-acetyltransferase [Thiotrichaceae bacterium]|nr:GNAT family N-acetyltransferase [Thiotrichaceae bacterium]
MEIKFKLIEQNNIEVILPLFYQLDSSISKPVLKTRLSEMIEKGYECVWRHLEPDNVDIKPEYRDQGIGNKLDAWLKEFALSRGCEAIELNCYLKNEKGRNYWESNEYNPIGMHYQKKLNH